MSETAIQPTTSTAVAEAKKPKTIRDHLSGDEFKRQVALALPKHVTPERFVRVALTAINRNPKLAECSQASLFECLMTLSALGLEADGRRAHLIPYGEKCTLIVDFKGKVELVMRSGEVSNIHADVVCENDEFEYNLGEIKTHRISFKKPRGDMYAVYAVVTMKDGTKKAEVMSKEDVDSIRKRSRSGNSGPWVTDYAEMAKKGLAIDTRIPTFHGWKTMDDIEVGDVVFDKDGTPVAVRAISEIKHIECFRVVFSRGDSIVCDNEHRWLARTGGADAHKKEFAVATVNELMAAKKRGESVTIPVQGALNLPRASLPIDPYILGYWLGNGKARAASVTCHSSDHEHVKAAINSSGFKLGKSRNDGRSKACCVGIKGGFLSALRDLNLLRNKHVPEIYLRSSIDQRLELLRGLMDSDGHLDKARGRAHFYNTNKSISDAVAELVASLGDVPNRVTKKMRGFDVECIAHAVFWQPSLCCVRLPRKVLNYKPRKITKYRSIKSIEPIDSVPTKCIGVSGPSKTYLAGETMAVTHNTVFHRCSKWLPMSSELREKIEKDDDFEPTLEVAKPAFAGSVIDGKATEAKVEVMDSPFDELRKLTAEAGASEADLLVWCVANGHIAPTVKTIDQIPLEKALTLSRNFAKIAIGKNKGAV